jgi:tRNA pseudouridine38-40 synthase
MEEIRNIKMVLEYDGTHYHGWQVQGQAPTIQKIVEETLKKITQEDVKTVSSGRTDAGVHALGQVINFTIKKPMESPVLLRAMNALLPEDISVKEASDVPLDFHARFSARSKTYSYFIWNSPIRSAFLERYAWHIPYRLNLELIREAAECFIGTHDFSSFRASSCEAKNPVRTVLSSDIQKRESLLEITFEANAFLQYMVRNIVGTLVEVGREKIKPIDIKRLLERRDRKKAGPTSPPQGLFLISVQY